MKYFIKIFKVFGDSFMIKTQSQLILQVEDFIMKIKPIKKTKMVKILKSIL